VGTCAFLYFRAHKNEAKKNGKKNKQENRDGAERDRKGTNSPFFSFAAPHWKSCSRVQTYTLGEKQGS
jgi:hypothetical protein